MKDYLFLSFLDEFRAFDPVLVESIYNGYITIFESFSVSAYEVMKAYNDLLSATEVLVSGNTKYIPIKINGIDINVKFLPGVGRCIGGESMLNNEIFIRSTVLWRSLIYDDIDTFRKSIMKPDLRHLITHEIAHWYEFTRRDKDILKTQIKSRMRAREGNITDEEYHNHRSETLANIVSFFASLVYEALSNDISDVSDIMAYVKKHIGDQSDDNPAMSNTLKSLSPKNLERMLNKISTAVYIIVSDHDSDLKTISNIISSKLKDNV